MGGYFIGDGDGKFLVGFFCFSLDQDYFFFLVYIVFMNVQQCIQMDVGFVECFEYVLLELNWSDLCVFFCVVFGVIQYFQLGVSVLYGIECYCFVWLFWWCYFGFFERIDLVVGQQFVFNGIFLNGVQVV